MLKRLELQGFKSFAEKTVLEFPSRITAVVGPNGSGKSNVVDAIRWVLGEQSLKNLRSVKSEDVIFAGTPKRSASAFAAVSLHFSNEEKIFPLEYAEVSMGRKLYRDGTSEYLVNREDARLKDIVQVLASARLGVKGLAVIGQGAGDVFLRATSQERREMLEEVIGLKEFRMKKEEASRKLDETASNIEKVRALLAEIEPHLRSLKRQAARWEKRQEKETLLKQLEEAYFRVRLSEVERFGEDFQNEKASLEEEIAELSLETKRLEAEFVSRQELLSKAGGETRRFDEALHGFEEKRAGILRELGKLEGRIEAEAERGVKERAVPREELLEQLSRVRAELKRALSFADADAARQALEELVRGLDEFFQAPLEAKSRSTFVEEKDALIRSLAELEASIRELEEKKKAMGAEDETARLESRKSLEALEAARAALREKETALGEYRLESEKRDLRESELKMRFKEAGWEYDAFRAEWAGKEAPTLDGTLDELETRMLKLRRDLSDIGAVDEEMLREYKETEARAEFLSSQKDDLEKAKKDLSGLAEDLEKKITTDFGRALRRVDEQFEHYFKIIFGGGHARLREERVRRVQKGAGSEGGEVEGEDETGRAGVEISVELPRKKVKGIDVLSGGERALTSIALIFAVVGTSSPPFLVLDEIDAPLDETNSQRFAKLLKELSSRTQFILITHNRATMEAADILYGVTIEDGMSKVFSLKFEEAERVAAQDVHPV